jgi:imidazole glycerol-phosphate synthase subunit HisH
MVVVIDYGVGNLMAIQNIIKKAGGTSIISDDREQILRAKKIILPGVGSFKYCADQLASRELIPILNEAVADQSKKILGLCVGAQLMTKESEEGNARGLGWVDAITVKFDSSKVTIVPHMGWTNIQFEKQSALASGLETEARFYFVHSYHFVFTDPAQVLATASFGYNFACAFERNNVAGVQFHPEKSHRFGIKLFENYLAS